jgi:hypothetical protein
MRFSKEEKALWLEDWEQSGKSAWTYAKGNGLNPQTFVRWTKTETEPKPRFVEVQAELVASVRHTPEILIEKGAVKIHIPVDVGSGELRTVLEGLRGML